jgi:hypothetical protein
MQLEDILMRALVLHTHSIALRPGVFLDDVQRSSDEQRLVLAPLTRTHVIELVSTLWPKDEERGQENFWFYHFNSLAAYEVFEDVPEYLRGRADAARMSIAVHDLVQELAEE